MACYLWASWIRYVTSIIEVTRMIFSYWLDNKHLYLPGLQSSIPYSIQSKQLHHIVIKSMACRSKKMQWLLLMIHPLKVWITHQCINRAIKRPLSRENTKNLPYHDVFHMTFNMFYHSSCMCCIFSAVAYTTFFYFITLHVNYYIKVVEIAY